MSRLTWMKILHPFQWRKHKYATRPREETVDADVHDPL